MMVFLYSLGAAIGFGLAYVTSNRMLYGFYGAAMVLGVSILWTLIAFATAPSIVLSLAGAREISHDDAPMLYNVVSEMAIAAGIPTPRVYIMETPALNAFATGLKPEKSAVAVTRGLLETLNREELQGVIGHEVGHLINGDSRYATLVAVMVGLIALLCDIILRNGFNLMAMSGSSRRSNSSDSKGGGAAIMLPILIVLLILSPIIAKLLQMAVSRQREYMADATSVKLTRNPVGLVHALEKLEASTIPLKSNRAIQHLFIVNPLQNITEKTLALFSTHPPTNLRIKRLLYLG